jgi:hypothetical protein
MSLATVVRNTAPSPRQPHLDLRAIVTDLRRKNKRANDTRIVELLQEMIEDDPVLLRCAVRFIVERMPAARAPSMSERVARQSARTAEKVAVQAIAAKARQQIVLDTPITLLSGETKQLRFCLGSEIGQLGAAFGRIAERVGPTNMVGECLCEQEARQLLLGS